MQYNLVQREDVKMKKWESPIISELGIDKTFVTDYITSCDWNEVEICSSDKYTDPNKKPSQHPTWVWCQVHNRWHPKNHKDEINGPIGGIIS